MPQLNPIALSVHDDQLIVGESDPNEIDIARSKHISLCMKNEGDSGSTTSGLAPRIIACAEQVPSSSAPASFFR